MHLKTVKKVENVSFFGYNPDIGFACITSGFHKRYGMKT